MTKEPKTTLGLKIVRVLSFFALLSSTPSLASSWIVQEWEKTAEWIQWAHQKNAKTKNPDVKWALDQKKWEKTQEFWLKTEECGKPCTVELQNLWAQHSQDLELKKQLVLNSKVKAAVWDKKAQKELGWVLNEALKLSQASNSNEITGVFESPPLIALSKAYGNGVERE